MSNNKRGRPAKGENNTPLYIRGKYTPALGEVTNAYNLKAYFTARLHKNEKPLISAAAKKTNLSLNGFVEDAVRRRVAEVLTEEDIVKALNETDDSE